MCKNVIDACLKAGDNSKQRVGPTMLILNIFNAHILSILTIE